MNEKLNIQDLIDLLTARTGINKKNSEAFVREFFALIEESLEKDKYVKIKGLGTFKLINVESRESVNVNTGERIEIHGHSKVSFTPDSSLKEIINKPFSHFETVVLNEGVVFEDMPMEGDADDSLEGNGGPVVENAVSDSVTKEAAEPKKESATVFVDNEFKKEETNEDSAVREVQQTIEPTKPAESVAENNCIKHFIYGVIAAMVFCLAVVLYMYMPYFWNTPEEQMNDVPERPLVNYPEEKVAMSTLDSTVLQQVADTLKEDTVQLLPKVEPAQEIQVQTPSAPEKKQVKNETAVKPKVMPKKPFVSDSVGYTIIGTETNYTLKEGETLTKVALRFYGTKALWPYIVKHNSDVIKNPNHVPYGTKLKIPKLKKKQ